MTDRRFVALVTVALVVLSAWAIVAGSGIPRVIVDLDAGAARSDESLYERTAERVAEGEYYYAVAVDEQAAAHYPTSPPPAIRLPTTTVTVAALGDAAPWALRGLLVLTAIVAMLRFERIAPTRIEWLLSTLLLAGSIGMLAHPRAALLAEAWAIALILLSLLLHRPGRYVPSVLLGLMALCFRELAVPFLLVMAACAWRRDRKESFAWLSAVATFAVLYAAHWAAAARAARDIASVESPGWLWFGGWPHVVDTFSFSSLLRTLPYEVSVVVLPLSILGWLVVRGDYRNHVLALSAVFMAIFLFAGRPDTAYWGRLYVPLLFPGLAFAPRAIAILVRGERPTHVDAPGKN